MSRIMYNGKCYGNNITSLNANSIIYDNSNFGTVDKALTSLIEDPDNGYTYNLRDFYKKENGDLRTDDEAFEAAINAVPAHGTLFVPTKDNANHEYRITKSIVINKPIRFIGEYDGYVIGTESGTTIPLSSNNTPTNGASARSYQGTYITTSAIIPMISIQCSGVTIKNICLKSMATTDGCGIRLTLAGVDSAANIATGGPHYCITKIKIEDVAIFLNGGHGRGIDCSSFAIFMSSFKNVHIDQGATGFQITPPGDVCTTLIFENCWTTNQWIVGYNLKNVTYSTFISCGADSGGWYNNEHYGYNFVSCHDVTLLNCGVERWASNGLRCTNCDGITINMLFAFNGHNYKFETNATTGKMELNTTREQVNTCGDILLINTKALILSSRTTNGNGDRTCAFVSLYGTSKCEIINSTYKYISMPDKNIIKNNDYENSNITLKDNTTLINKITANSSGVTLNKVKVNDSLQSEIVIDFTPTVEYGSWLQIGGFPKAMNDVDLMCINKSSGEVSLKTVTVPTSFSWGVISTNSLKKGEAYILKGILKEN